MSKKRKRRIPLIFRSFKALAAMISIHLLFSKISLRPQKQSIAWMRPSVAKWLVQAQNNAFYIVRTVSLIFRSIKDCQEHHFIFIKQRLTPDTYIYIRSRLFINLERPSPPSLSLQPSFDPMCNPDLLAENRCPTFIQSLTLWGILNLYSSHTTRAVV